jgi:hypothetical protein
MGNNRLPDDKNSASSTSTSSSSSFVILDGSESAEIRRLVERQRNKAQDAVEGDEELSLASLLDYLGCDDWVVEAFLVRVTITISGL